MSAFGGSIVALVTPFKNGAVDIEKYKDLVRMHEKSGTSGVCAAGTTGEGGMLGRDERRAVFAAAREAAGAMKVIAGVGTNSTRKTIQNAVIAAEEGADALLVVTPYYNRPSDRGLVAHYEAVAKATRLPIILYNVPSRTGLNMSPEVIGELAKIPNVAAIKEASGSLAQIDRIRQTTKLQIISGDDALTWPILKLGGVGVISVAANIIPREMRDLCAGTESTGIDKKFHRLFKTLFIETNPIPVKAAMRHMGLIDGDEMRLPLTPLSEENDRILVDMLHDYSLM